MGAKLEQTVGALRGDGGTVVECHSRWRMSDGSLHVSNLANLRSRSLASLRSSCQPVIVNGPCSSSARGPEEDAVR
jgi:hypothetical protein